MVSDGQKWLACRGGNGGWGNLHFKSSTNRAPKQHNDGLPGEERTLSLRLKLIADVGLIGFPNAGKSSLLSALTNARPKIADYPFTTLTPGLGIMYSHGREFVMVDLPGLIKGASAGVGLGDKFLGHAERTKLILHVIDGTAPDVAERYGIIRGEIDSYGDMAGVRAGGPGMTRLADKPEIIVVNKIDMLSDDELAAKVYRLKRVAKKATIVPISAAGRVGLDNLKSAVEKQL
jgi:GTP-binding protein